MLVGASPPTRHPDGRVQRSFVAAAHESNPSVEVLDTRKTTPGLRVLEKAAVRAGGGTSHRAGLSDAILLKDNHLAGTSITAAVRRARALWPGRVVEIECDALNQVGEAARVLQAGLGQAADDRLARTLMTYELALKKLDHGERSLKLAEKKWELELERDSGQSEEATGEVVEFDHREKIAAMRKAMFKDVDDLLASGKLVIPKATW